MLDFEVQRCSRRCATSGRELQPGDVCYSVLVPDGANVQRIDYAADAWKGAPENALGWWRSKIPEPNQARLHWAPNEVLLEYFRQLTDQLDKADERYVLALLLVRRRLLRLEDTIRDAAGHEVMTLFSPRHETQYQVVVRLPDDEQIQRIQANLGRLFSADVPAVASQEFHP